ncbi:MAG: PQQ-binding-like beta-propeller repeat protein [bacterium]|nr:PQQ-binding-like beta-propeller repeat protein [bacterium]
MSAIKEAFSLQDMKATLKDHVFVTKEQQRIVSVRGGESRWIFDFRRVVLRPNVLNGVSELFWKHCAPDEEFQVAGLEAAALPLVAGIVMKGVEKKRPINGFFIRKSRKKTGLMQMVEGEINNTSLILVDDILNSGKTFIRQIELLEALGKKVHTVFVVLRFRDLSYYQYFHDRKIKIVSLLELDDLKDTLPVATIRRGPKKPVPMPFLVEWKFSGNNPDFSVVRPKSGPVCDDVNVYFGSDDGIFYCLRQADGAMLWHYKTGLGSKGAMIHSTPALYDDYVYFGSNNGNFYALDKKTGQKRWIYMEADWVQSSPCVAPDLSLVFVGLKFGLLRKQGGIVALDARSGKKKWDYRTSEHILSSPTYDQASGRVYIGGEDGVLRALNARTGKLLWTFTTRGHIRDGVAIHPESGHIALSSFDGKMYVLDGETGTEVMHIQTEEPVYARPLFYGKYAYIASLDKVLYCVDLERQIVKWKFATKGRVFTAPCMIEGKIYIGSNDARLYELNPETGKNTGFFQSIERITHAPAYNPVMKRFFVPTFANEIYCLSRKN